MDKIEVTQADRDAAASLMSDVGLFSNVLTAKAVQAFARHRTTHPPATDVAALVEAAKETNAALERDGDPAFAHLILDNKAALAPFTKDQNDDAVR